MSAKYGYIGNNPSDTSVVVAKQVFAPTGVQTTFTFVSGYSIGYLDVYINGSRQVEGQDYNATDTSTVGLSSAAQGGDIIELVAYKAFNVATVDTIPGDLRVQGKLTVVGLTTGSNAFYSGIVTATSFSGDGSGLTGISSVSFATTSFGLSGSPNITVGVITATEFDISGSSNTLNAGGLSVGIATATTLSGTSGLVSVGTTIKVKGFVETQSTVSIAGTILTLDASQGTVFTHTTSAQIGIVSFTGIRTDSAGAQTFSVLVTQGATPRNTTGATGIGTILSTVVITPGNIGYSTHIKVGGGTTITLTNSAGAFDLLTFIVSYDGNTSIGNTSFTVVGFAATDFRNTVV